MNLSLVIIFSFVFGIVAVIMLSYIQYRDHQILGITISEEHSQHSDVKKIVRAFRKICISVLVFSVGCSVLFMLPAMANDPQIFIHLLVVLNLFANYLVFWHYQKKLTHVKEQNNWIYKRSDVVSVDITISREKGKSSVSSIWIWLFLSLSFVPLLIWLFIPSLHQIYPGIFFFCGPFCQVFTVFLYYQIRNQQTRVIHDKSEVNLAFMRQKEKLNSIIAVLISFMMLIFWILLAISVLPVQNSILSFIPLLFLLVSMIVITQLHRNRNRKLEEKFFGKLVENNIQEMPDLWKWGFYHNPNDSRFIVPKRIPAMGWTINIAHRSGKIFMLAVLVLILAGLYPTIIGNMQDYQIHFQESGIYIDAPMYDMTFEKEQLHAVTVIDSLPVGTRTNGYGGSNKSFGHFSLNGYGHCMLYIYNNVDRYIVVELKGASPGYVIINGKTKEETEILYQTIDNWSSE